eukprot:4295070-Amphidinium_carterae.5
MHCALPTFASAHGPLLKPLHLADLASHTFEIGLEGVPRMAHCGVAVVHVCDAPSSTYRPGVSSSSRQNQSQELPATLLDASIDDVVHTPSRENWKDDPLALPLVAQPKKTKKSGSFQPRWAHRSKSDSELDTMAEQFRSLNALPDRHGKHVVLLCKDGAPIAACADPHILKESMPKDGLKLKKQVLGVVSPLNERVQFGTRLCRKAKSLAPESDVSRMAEDLRMVLSHEMSRGSSFTESHLASVRDLALQCQQVLSERTAATASLSSYSGGYITVASFNVGGLQQKLEGVLNLNFDLVGLREVGASRTHTESLRRLATQQNWQLSFGPTPKANRDAMGRKRVNPSLGVAALTRSANRS